MGSRDELEKSVPRLTQTDPRLEAMPAAQVVRPPDGGAEPGLRDHERLQILAGASEFQRAQMQWFGRLQERLPLILPKAARQLGFGRWKKRYPTPRDLIEALERHWRPACDAALQTMLPPLEALHECGPPEGEREGERLFVALAPLSGEPPLHPSYVQDLERFAATLSHDEIKHVAHSYTMALAHGLIRQEVAKKRAGEPAVFGAELLYVFEVNLCQYYVPVVSHFESQPMRMFTRELANRFRKVAFGGQ